MTAKDLIEHLTHMVANFPECAEREVKILTEHGRMEIDEVTISATSNLWLIQK